MLCESAAPRVALTGDNAFVPPIASRVVALLHVSLAGQPDGLVALGRNGELIFQIGSRPKVRSARGSDGVALQWLGDGVVAAVLQGRLECVCVVDAADPCFLDEAPHEDACAATVAPSLRVVAVAARDSSRVALHYWDGQRVLGSRVVASLHARDGLASMAWSGGEAGGLITADDAGSLGVWSRDGQTPRVVGEAPRSARVTAMAAHASRSLVFLGTSTGEVLAATLRGRLVEARGEMSPTHARGPVSHLLLRGARLVSVGASDIRIFDILTFRCVAVLKPPAGYSGSGWTAVALRCDAQRRILLSAACAQGSIHSWDASGCALDGVLPLQGLCVLHLRDCNRALPASVRSVYSKSAALFAAASESDP